MFLPGLSGFFFPICPQLPNWWIPNRGEFKISLKQKIFIWLQVNFILDQLSMINVIEPPSKAITWNKIWLKIRGMMVPVHVHETVLLHVPVVVHVILYLHFISMMMSFLYFRSEFCQQTGGGVWWGFLADRCGGLNHASRQGGGERPSADLGQPPPADRQAHLDGLCRRAHSSSLWGNERRGSQSQRLANTSL